MGSSFYKGGYLVVLVVFMLSTAAALWLYAHHSRVPSAAMLCLESVWEVTMFALLILSPFSFRAARWYAVVGWGLALIVFAFVLIIGPARNW